MTVQDHTEKNNDKSDKKKKRKNEKSNVKGNDEVILISKKLNACAEFHCKFLQPIHFLGHVNLYFRLNVEKLKKKIQINHPITLRLN